jgi:hypothetical protein
VSAMAGMLAELSGRTGQVGAMDSLDHFLFAPTAMAKTPHLVLVGLRPGVNPSQASAQDVLGAVLLYEYRLGGVGTRVFATDDYNGQRTAIAAPEVRREVVDTACRALIEGGALAVLVSYEAPNPAAQTRRTNPLSRLGCLAARRSRMVANELPLETTFDATLATLGPNTRRNLVRYRRKAESELGAVFIPRVRMNLREFLAANRDSTNPVPDAMGRWRYSCTVSNIGARTSPMFAGLKSADGRWLSLIGGRRRRGVTEIDWQMNRAGLPSASLSTVMRSYILEHEVALGTQRLAFEGGTPHSIRHSFAWRTTEDVIMRRRSWRFWAVRAAVRWGTPQQNLLGQLLVDPDLDWS